MTKTYHKPRTFTRADATRKTLREYAANDRVEKHIDTIENEMAKVARNLRARLVAENPTSPDAEIDAKVARIMSAGQRQTTEQVPAPRSIPREVIEARRAERRKEVRKRREFRRPGM